MRVILVSPYIPLEVIYGKAFAQAGAVLPPLGILYITSYLKTKNKHDIEILDANALKRGAEETVEYILRNNFECAGFSATTLSYPYAVEIARLIRKKSPGIKLVIGGTHAQQDPATILAENPGLFDFVCYGEGEYAFESLLDYLTGAISKEKLLGWSYLEKGRIVKGQPAPIPENLDVFGHPAEIVPAEYITLYHEKILAYKKLPIFSVITSRGCPFQCTFCSTPNKFNYLYNKKMRYHSIKWVCQELKILEDKHGVREITFVDDTFNLRKTRVIELCQAKIKNNIRLVWTCSYEANIVDIQMMKKMRNAGCWGIMVGGESGSDRMLEFIKKGVTSRQLYRLGEIANSVGIVCRASFIIGFPGDTKETIEETINFVKRSSFHFPYFQLYIPLPGTEMFGQLQKYGMIIQGDPKERSACKVNYIPHGLTEEYLLDAFHRAHRTAYLRWGMIKNHLKFIRSIADIKRYWQGLMLLSGI